MRYIGIIILLVLCLTLLLFTGCMINTVTPETVYPQQWATGDGTVENPWANNCIQKAYDFVPAGGTIFLKAGYYTLSARLIINRKVNIIGEGRNKSIIVLDIEDTNGIYLEADYCTLKGFTMDGDSQADETSSLINIHDCDYVLLEDIEVKNAGSCGINLYRVNHSSFQNIYAHDNYDHGMHSHSSAITGRNKYNIYRDIYAWNNGYNGFDDWGSGADPNEQLYNVYDNLQCWDNGKFGIAIGCQKGGVLSNSFVSGNGEHGIYLSEIGDFNIHDCFVTLSSLDGIEIKLSSDNVNFTNVIVKNNNVSNTDYTGGIRITNSNGIRLTSCQSYDDRDIPIQEYGILIIGAVDFVEIINCILTPNEISSIVNNAGAVIIEKMLAKL